MAKQAADEVDKLFQIPLAEFTGARNSLATKLKNEGDTVKSIALKFGLRPRDLRAVNDIGKDVVVGQRLRIPAQSVSPP